MYFKTLPLLLGSILISLILYYTINIIQYFVDQSRTVLIVSEGLTRSSSKRNYADRCLDLHLESRWICIKTSVMPFLFSFFVFDVCLFTDVIHMNTFKDSDIQLEKNHNVHHKPYTAIKSHQSVINMLPAA